MSRTDYTLLEPQQPRDWSVPKNEYVEDAGQMSRMDPIWDAIHAYMDDPDNGEKQGAVIEEIAHLIVQAVNEHDRIGDILQRVVLALGGGDQDDPVELAKRRMAEILAYEEHSK